MAGNTSKYAAAGAGGVVAGAGASSVFAFELFQKLGADKLLILAQGTAAHIYAITALCMISCIVLGTGFIVIPSATLDLRAKLLVTITGVFLLAFLGGFLAIVFRNESVYAKFVVEDYQDQFLNFHDGKSTVQFLHPYIKFPKLVVSDDEDQGTRLVNDQEVIQVGVDNLAGLEQKYYVYLQEDPNYHRDERDLAQLCSSAPLNSSPACRDWQLPTAGQAQ